MWFRELKFLSRSEHVIFQSAGQKRELWQNGKWIEEPDMFRASTAMMQEPDVGARETPKTRPFPTGIHA